MTLQEFAANCLDRMYTPGIREKDQASGWKWLKHMVLNDLYPVEDNLIPFHVLIRPVLEKHWDIIKTLKVE